MLLPLLPRWQGQAWPVKRTPITSTRIARHVSGREVRAPLFATPMYAFEISFDGLSSNTAFPGLAERSLQELQGFYLARSGADLPFLYIDPADNTAVGQVLGVGDGSTMSFPFQRAVGSQFVEPVAWVTNVAAVYVGGVKIGTTGSGWSLVQPASLNLSAAPPQGAIILADFTYAFICRFSDDTVDLSHDMDGVWSMDSLKFQTVR